MEYFLLLTLKNLMIIKIYLFSLCLFSSCDIISSFGDNRFVNQSKISDNIYNLYYEGTRYNNSIEAFDYVLLKAGQITMSEGNAYFIVQNLIQKDNISTNADKEVITKPYCSCSIQTFKTKPEINLIVYNAEEVVKNMNQKYFSK